MRSWIKNIFKLIIFFALVLGIFISLNEVFIYKDTSIWSSDARIKKYSELPKDSIDVLFLGSSNVMTGINPLQLWKETGIQAYDCATRAQTFGFTYGYIIDALRKQHPKVIVVDAYSLFDDKGVKGMTNSELHFTVNNDNLSSRAKNYIIDDYVTDEDKWWFYFPLFKNHYYYKLWDSYQSEGDTDKIFFGYSYADYVQECDNPIYTENIGEMDAIDEKYSNLIIDYCENQGIDLIFIKTPISTDDFSKLNRLKELCDRRGIAFYDMNSDYSQWGFDYSKDMMDEMHINSYGAEKCTTRIGEKLLELYEFRDNHNDEYANVWEKEYDRMMGLREQMLAEE